nr:hypothetical protein [Tanacetum cinerariifolium]
MKRGFYAEHAPLFPCMLAIQAEEGKGSGHPSEPQPPPSTTQPTNEDPILTVVSSSHQKTQISRQALNKVTELPQTSESIPNIADEAVYEEWDDRVESAATIAASLDADQASGNINMTQSITMPNVPLPQGISAVIALETNLRQTKKVYGAVYTKLIMKGRSIIEEIDQDTGVTLVQTGFDDKTNFYTATQTYTRRIRAGSTGSARISTASRLFSIVEESVSTAGASMPVCTASVVHEVNISIPSPVAVKDKGRAVRLQKEIDEKEIQMMARVHEVAQSFTKKEWENIRARVKADEVLTQRLQAEERNKVGNHIEAYQFFIDMLKAFNRDDLVLLWSLVKEKLSSTEPTDDKERTLWVELKRVGNHIEAYQFFVDMLKAFNRDDLVLLWSLVKEKMSSTEPTDDKERTLWVELKRLFEPNTDDTL